MALGLALAAVPFLFGLMRAWTTGTDFRYLWVAAGASIGAWLVLRTARPSTTRIVLAFASATAAAGAAAVWQGARSVPSVLLVALGFATCEAVGLGLALRARKAA